MRKHEVLSKLSRTHSWDLIKIVSGQYRRMKNYSSLSLNTFIVKCIIAYSTYKTISCIKNITTFKWWYMTSYNPFWFSYKHLITWLNCTDHKVYNILEMYGISASMEHMNPQCWLILWIHICISTSTSHTDYVADTFHALDNRVKNLQSWKRADGLLICLLK